MHFTHHVHFTHHKLYPLQRLLSSGARTANGDEADYFYLPMNIRQDSLGLGGQKSAENLDQYLVFDVLAKFQVPSPMRRLEE